MDDIHFGWWCMRKIHILLVFIACGTQHLLTSSFEIKSLEGNSFSPAQFAISLKSYNAAFITSSFCVDDEEKSGMPIGYVRELCDKCESCSWKKRIGFTSEIEWETAVTTEMSRLCGHSVIPEKQIVGTWIAEAPLSLHTTKTSIGDLASKLGVTLEDSPIVPETQDRVYYMVSGTPGEVQDLLAAGFSTVTPVPPRLKVDPSLEAAAVTTDQAQAGGDFLRSARNDQWGEDVGKHLHVQISLPPTSSVYLNASSTPGLLPPPGSSAYLLASAWSTMISSRLGHDKASVMAKGEKHITVHGLQSSAEWYQVALEIAHHGAVQWVAPQARLIPSNYFARQLVESGTWYVPEVWRGDKVPDVYSPLSAIGLTGKGEVVGIADTGLDWNSCFFKDDKVTPRFKWNQAKRDSMRQMNSPPEIWESSKHRKIRQYVAYMNGEEDENDGHGTHISGSVAGSCLELDVINRDYAGVAPDAKIAFFDAYSKTEPDEYGISSHMIGYMFDIARGVGAHVYVASFNEGGMNNPEGWGMNGAVPYSTLAKSIDESCYLHQNFIVLVSAGNYIASPWELRRGYIPTISRPAEAKSVVTVGSHFNPDKGYGEAPDDVDRVLAVASHSGQGPTHDGRIKPDVCGPGDGIYSAASTMPDSSDRPIRRTLTTSASDEVALKTRWGGGRGSSTAGGDSTDTPGRELPIADGGTASATGEDSGNCRGVVKRGTSSANAIVAGVTVLVRQYFTKGYYPDGVKKKRAGFTPMGALLKAVLVNSGRQLTDPEGAQQEGLPNNKMGWGGVNIASTLVTPSSPPGLQLKVFGKSQNMCEFQCPHVSQGQAKVYKIRTTPETYNLPLKVTLAWYDKAGAVASRNALVNDLDLTVMETGATTRDNVYYFANGVLDYDHINTVEHIEVTAPTPNTEYTIRVAGAVVPSHHQYYALVISGPFDAKACTTKKERAARRGAHGRSVD